MVNSNYLLDRIYTGLGLTDEMNKFMCKVDFQSQLFESKLITHDRFGDLQMPVYTLDREPWAIDSEKQFASGIIHEFKESWTYTRYTPDKARANGKKSNVKAGVTPPPWFSPSIISNFEDGNDINTLYITEGYIKSLKMHIDGLQAIGFSGISVYRDKDTKGMFKDVHRVIRKCSVKNIVIVYDQDCRDISLKSIDKGYDIKTRPSGFYKAFDSISQLLAEYSELNICFCSLLDPKYKGIDDLFQEVPESINELKTFETMSGEYFYKTFKKNEVRKFLHLDSIEDFAQFHSKKLNGLTFKWYKDKYALLDGELKKIEPEKPFDLVRVGNHFYRLIDNKDYQKLMLLKRETVKDDYGKEVFETVLKCYEFCNIPCNTFNEYKRITNDNRFNMYNRLKWDLTKAGEFPNIKQLIHHIFGDKYYEMGLDYLKLLFFKPQQILPILAIVSKDRKTGKTTFVEWLKHIFKANMSILSNEDVNGNWNDHYITKLLIAIEETNIDKADALQKIKNYSTASYATLHKRFADTQDVEVNLKIIINSNEIAHFAKIDQEETRYWVVKVPKIPTKEDARYKEKLRDETIFFLHFLRDRPMYYEFASRYYFDETLMENENLSLIKETSKDWGRTEVEALFADLFSNEFAHLEEVQYLNRDIRMLFFDKEKKLTQKYLDKILGEMGLKQSDKTIRYTRYKPTGTSLDETTKTGRPYTISRSLFVTDTIEDDSREDTPF